MKGFLLWGLVFGFLCLGFYVALSVFQKKTPVMAHGFELLLSGSGLFGGIKICWFVFGGELSKLIEAKPLGSLTSISPEDVIYFAVGGIALGWLSLETIVKRFITFTTPTGH